MTADASRPDRADIFSVGPRKMCAADRYDVAIGGQQPLGLALDRWPTPPESKYFGKVCLAS